MFGGRTISHVFVVMIPIAHRTVSAAEIETACFFGIDVLFVCSLYSIRCNFSKESNDVLTVNRMDY